VIFQPTPISGAFVIEAEPVRDERGWFARTFCREEFRHQGLDPCVAQCGVSFNPQAGTLRGLHLQSRPHAENKLVGCTRGAVYDVILDLRNGSPTFRSWWAVELKASSLRMLYVPEGVAHGFQTLEADTEVSYQMSRPYAPDAATGVRWNDPAFGIAWPLEVTVISPADRGRAQYAHA
jgi:dTDP-4-dehydrorhamnose 3,5-epimerase